jgi:methionine-rich copper-binding protein CopC
VNYERYRPQIEEPLVVAFEVATGNGDYKRTLVGVENDFVASFQLPTNSSLKFNYHVGCKALSAQQNVILYFDSCSSDLVFLDANNQTYSIPHKDEIGTMETNTVKLFSATLETPLEAGIYQMRWHITSDSTNYSFVILVWASDRLN